MSDAPNFAEPDSNAPAARLPDNSPDSGNLPDSANLFGRYAVLFAADICSRGLRFLADVVLFRHFEQQVFGQLNLAQALAIQGMGISTCGLDTAGTRDAASGAIPLPTLALTIVALRLATGMIGWGAVAGLALIIPQYHASFELAVLYGLSIFSGALTLGWVAQGRGQVHIVGMAALATQVGYFCGVELAAWANWPPVSIPLLLLLSETLSALALWTWLWRTVGPMTKPLPLSRALALQRDSLPIGIASYLRLLTIGSDVLLLGLFATDAELGQYSVGFKLYSVAVSMQSVYFAVLLPHLAGHAAGTLATIRTNLISALRRSLAIVAPAAVVVGLCADPLLHLLFPRALHTAVGILQILAVAIPVNLGAGHFRSVLLAVGRQRLDVRLVAIGAIVHVAAKLFLIPLLGMLGAAWGTVLGETVVMLLAWQACRAVLRENV